MIPTNASNYAARDVIEVMVQASYGRARHTVDGITAQKKA